MFGLGFTEILLIAVVALLFIGPDKLPDTMKTIARTLGKAKRMFDDTKDTIQNELRIDELREEALGYKAEIEKAKSDLSAFKNVANKEIEEVAQSAKINTEFEPKDINDDSDLFEEFDKADKEFEELEQEESIKRVKPTKELSKTKDPYANSNQEERFEELKKEQHEESEKQEESENQESQTIEFKHLQTKES